MFKYSVLENEIKNILNCISCCMAEGAPFNLIIIEHGDMVQRLFPKLQLIFDNDKYPELVAKISKMPSQYHKLITFDEILVLLLFSAIDYSQVKTFLTFLLPELKTEEQFLKFQKYVNNSELGRRCNHEDILKNVKSLNDDMLKISLDEKFIYNLRSSISEISFNKKENFNYKHIPLNSTLSSNRRRSL